ncbi:MAG: hypothetical protein M1827_006220 [Pycnora praestabilis]|nr:MAG: hypothetical protein M1827_006220 [Pycnora praestabilis]
MPYTRYKFPSVAAFPEESFSTGRTFFEVPDPISQLPHQQQGYQGRPSYDRIQDQSEAQITTKSRSSSLLECCLPLFSRPSFLNPTTASKQGSNHHPPSPYPLSFRSPSAHLRPQHEAPGIGLGISNTSLSDDHLPPSTWSLPLPPICPINQAPYKATPAQPSSTFPPQQPTSPNPHSPTQPPTLQLRGGAGGKKIRRLEDDERPPALLFWLAGGRVHPPPTGAELRARKAATKAAEERKKAVGGGFWKGGWIQGLSAASGAPLKMLAGAARKGEIETRAVSGLQVKGIAMVITTTKQTFLRDPIARETITLEAIVPVVLTMKAAFAREVREELRDILECFTTLLVRLGE